MNSARRNLLEQPIDDAILDEATAHYAAPRTQEDMVYESALVFRLGEEWLALATTCLDRVTAPQRVHALPHRRSGATAGLVNVEGDLIVHVSLADLLGIDGTSVPRQVTHDRSGARLVVLSDSRGRLATTVDEILGIQRHRPSERRPAPATLARAPGSYTTGILEVANRTVGYLDVARVMDALSVAIA